MHASVLFIGNALHSSRVHIHFYTSTASSSHQHFNRRCIILNIFAMLIWLLFAHRSSNGKPNAMPRDALQMRMSHHCLSDAQQIAQMQVLHACIYDAAHASRGPSQFHKFIRRCSLVVRNETEMEFIMTISFRYLLRCVELVPPAINRESLCVVFCRHIYYVFIYRYRDHVCLFAANAATSICMFFFGEICYSAGWVLANRYIYLYNDVCSNRCVYVCVLGEENNLTCISLLFWLQFEWALAKLHRINRREREQETGENAVECTCVAYAMRTCFGLASRSPNSLNIQFTNSCAAHSNSIR